jgi:hypothetical protein
MFVCLGFERLGLDQARVDYWIVFGHMEKWTLQRERFWRQKFL